MEESRQYGFRSIVDVEQYSKFSSLSDAKLMTEDGSTFDIHRIILAKKSEYFRALFCGGFSKHKQEVFLIPRITNDCLNDILRYIYADDTTFANRNLPELLIASDYLLLNDLRQKIRQGIESDLSLDNCLGFLTSSYLINDVNVSSESLRFIEIHFEEIVCCQNYQVGRLPLEIFKRVISSLNLNMSGEKTVWMAIVHWVNSGVSDARLCSVPELLSYLAYEDLHETVATEILEHEIVVCNTDFQNFQNFLLMESVKTMTDNLARLRKFVAERSGPPRILRRHPPRLHFITQSKYEASNPVVKFYVTYDENLNIWHKVKEFKLKFIPFELFNIGFSVYIFNSNENGNFFRMDLKTKEVVPMANHKRHRRYSCVIEFEGRLYLFRDNRDTSGSLKMCYVEIYDPVTDSWSDGTPIRCISRVKAVCVENNMYIIGFMNDTDKMVAYVYSAQSPTWTPFPAPQTRSCFFLFFGCHSKLFVVAPDIHCNFQRVETFDIVLKEWRRVENLPSDFLWYQGTILNDKLFLYHNCYRTDSYILCWNDKLEKWEKMDIGQTLKPRRQKSSRHYAFCSMENPEIIRWLTRENMEKSEDLKQSHFDKVNIFQRKWFAEGEELEISSIHT